jgi:hypothetical protein
MERRELDWRLGLVEDAGRLSRRLGLGGVARRLSRRSGFIFGGFHFFFKKKRGPKDFHITKIHGTVSLVEVKGLS